MAKTLKMTVSNIKQILENFNIQYPCELDDSSEVHRFMSDIIVDAGNGEVESFCTDCQNRSSAQCWEQFFLTAMRELGEDV
jgi:hypothetical protein